MENRPPSLTQLSPVALACPHCGSIDLVRDAEHPNEYVCQHCRTRSRLLPRQGRLLILGWVCMECGHDNERGNRFCTQCGAGLTKNCPNCGAMMRVEDQFCNRCGRSRGQIVAQWYREGKAALDAGRPAEAIPPLQRLAQLDPEYGDVQRLLSRAIADARATQQPPKPNTPAPLSPAAMAVRDALASMKGDRSRARQRIFRAIFLTFAIMTLISTLVGTIAGSALVGVLVFLGLCAFVVLNIWIALHHL